jgi:hypothetical protein
MRRGLVAVLVLGALSSLPTSAGADSYASSGPGSSFAMSEEDRGHRYRFMGQLLGTAYSDRLLIGGEIELGKYETILAGMPGIQVKSYNLRGVVQVVAWPDRLSPYIGGAVGVNVLRLDEDAVESVISSVEIDNFGISLGGVAFVGIQLPISRDLSLFTEARVGALFDVIDPASVEMGIGGLDGYSGMTGLRMRF